MNDTHLTWRQSGGTHYGERNGATMVRLYEVNWGITPSVQFPALFVANWDAPIPTGWYARRAPSEWRGRTGTDEERDRLFEEAKAACERTFQHWLVLMGLMPFEFVRTGLERHALAPGDTVTVTGTVEV